MGKAIFNSQWIRIVITNALCIIVARQIAKCIHSIKHMQMQLHEKWTINHRTQEQNKPKGIY